LPSELDFCRPGFGEGRGLGGKISERTIYYRGVSAFYPK